MHDHSHHGHHHGHATANKRVLTALLVLSLLYMVAEIVGGMRAVSRGFVWRR